MANVKISQLPAGTALVGPEIAPFVQDGTTVSITADQIKTFATTGVDTIPFSLAPNAVLADDGSNPLIGADANGNPYLQAYASGAKTRIGATAEGAGLADGAFGVGALVKVDATTYTPGSKTFGLVTLTGGATTHNVPYEVALEVAIPFDFPFAGRTYTKAQIYPDGGVQIGDLNLGTDGVTYIDSPYNAPIPAAGTPPRFIAGVWTALNDDPQVVKTEAFGVTPNRTFVFYWAAADSHLYDDPTKTVEFQIILHENGNIEIQTAQAQAIDDASYGWAQGVVYDSTVAWVQDPAYAYVDQSAGNIANNGALFTYNGVHGADSFDGFWSAVDGYFSTTFGQRYGVGTKTPTADFDVNGTLHAVSPSFDRWVLPYGATIGDILSVFEAPGIPTLRTADFLKVRGGQSFVLMEGNLEFHSASEDATRYCELALDPNGANIGNFSPSSALGYIDLGFYEQHFRYANFERMNLTAIAEPSTFDLHNGEMMQWYDATNGAAKIKWRAKTADGTVVNGEVALTP